MKKFLALFLAIIIAITLVSCLDQKDTPTPAPDGGDISTTTTTTTKDYTPKKLAGYASSGEFGSPPITVKFYSVEEIQAFMKAANGTEEEFEKYHEEKNISHIISQKVAQILAHNMDIIMFPLTLTEESFNVCYDLSQNVLDICYGDGVYLTYRFMYFFNENTLPSRDAIPVKENVALGDYSIDFYEREYGGLTGAFLDKSVFVGVNIITDDFESASLEAFEMIPLADIK